MKNKIKLLLLALVVLTYSCKKQVITDEDAAQPEVTVERDYLVFKDYATFFKYYQLNSILSETERLKWEQSLKFNSLKTIYNKFNNELDVLEKGTKENYFIGFKSLKQQYQGSILFTEDSYKINSSGMREAALVNKAGILKIGKDYLISNEKGITTYKETSYDKILNVISSKVSTESQALSASAPPSGSFSSAIGGWNIINKERGRVLFRMKLYNINSSSIGYQSFSSLEGMAEHKNVFGTYRSVGMSLNFPQDTGFIPYIAITYENSTNSLYQIFASTVNLNPNFIQGLDNVENFDRVLCISQGLQNNVNQANQNVNGNSEFANYAISTRQFSTNDIYWKDVDMQFVKFGVLIQPGGPFGNPGVLFDLFTMDCKNGGSQYQ